jgi:hypothetical protein
MAIRVHVRACEALVRTRCPAAAGRDPTRRALLSSKGEVPARSLVVVGLALAAVLAACAAPAFAQAALAGEPIHITRATGSIAVDGDLSDPAWQHAVRIDRWYETKPGDNIEPPVRNVGYLAYDDRYLYAAFEFEDPDPSAIRAPFADRDNVGNGYNDYAGLLIDSRATGSNGVLFVASPRNTQYDSIIDDTSGEDSSPDFFWASAAKIGAHGWTLEMRIPFSSIRYRAGDPQTWHILLYRNYPRAFRYKFFSARIPRSSNCFVCRSNVLTGLERLPGGGHLVAAPYIAASDLAESTGGAGAPLGAGRVHAHGGLDVKYLPNADNALDATIKPDFSQVESDTAQIATNQRFALFYPETRPFFLEGLDLFSTPIQAVYTRTITAPVAGLRATGKALGLRYTMLVARDDGGGSAVIPGATGSSLASVDFGSTVFIARAKRDIGLSYISVLAADRERQDGQGSNRVVGPDMQWRPNGSESVTAQWLYSATETPHLPELAAEWDGRSITGHAATAQWNHSTTHLDWAASYRDVSSGFRADTGFVPQVGYRETFATAGWTVRPTNVLSRVRVGFDVDRQVDAAGALLVRDIRPGVNLDMALNGYVEMSVGTERTRTPGGVVIARRHVNYYVQFSPSQFFARVSLGGSAGGDIDFDNSRPAHGPTINASATIRPTNHLEVAIVANSQWLRVDAAGRRNAKLFTARVSRVKGTYTFTSRLFARAIAQYVTTDRDPSLYAATVTPRSASLSGSLLLAYKLNWQSVMYVGYGDNRAAVESLPGDPSTFARAGRLAPLDRQIFVKLSYAFQR